MNFIIITPYYNAGAFIGEAIDSIKQQTYPHFRCIILDDMSTDDSVRIVREHIGDDARFQLVVNQEKRFALGNVAHALALLQPQPDDVVMVVDGDDKLAHAGVLDVVKRVYEETGCWLTHGSYVNQYGKRDSICRPYAQSIIKHNTFREHKWLAQHLRTFKYGLWQKIKSTDFTITESELRRTIWRALLKGHLRSWYYWRKITLEQLLTPSKQFVRRLCDKTASYSMLEMAGPRTQFIEEVLYSHRVYDKTLDYRAPRTTAQMNQKWFTRCIRDIVVHKPKYSRLSNLNT
ncbi:MAG: glycosyltransferase family 2 protein [Gammaproteobacteria bacterium]|nr:glycosyltransferase family 2 protein [Gammaproteobacteria bacterium]